jgi:hypothetical protein
MNPIETLKQIKAIVFNEAPAPVAEPVQFSDYQLADGTIVSIDKLEVGGMVKIADAPAPAGSLTLADGTVIEVSEGGLIAAVTAPAAEEPASEDMSSKFAAIEAKFSAYESQFAQITEAHNNLKTAFEKQNEAMQGLVSLVETLVKEPSTEPSVAPTSGFRAFTETKQDKLNNVLKLFKN